MKLDNAIDFVYSYWNQISPLTTYEMHDKEFRDPYYTRKLIASSSTICRNKNVIVVGSKGKGTTSSLLAEVLRHQGLKVGLFTSPHIDRFTERIKINGREISREELIHYIESIKPAAEKIANEIPKPYYLGPNGIFLAVALKYFEDNNTDINVLESGRGGRYDDVYGMGNNIIITPIVLEHKNRLGQTINDIIETKLGIIDQNTKNVVISKQENNVLKIIEKLLPPNIRKSIYGKEFFLENHNVINDKSVFVINCQGRTVEVELSTIGKYIGINMSSALDMAAKIVKPLQLEPLKNMVELSFNGKVEIVSKNPLTIIDGVICRESADFLIESLNKVQFKKGKKIAIVAIPSDKDYIGVVETFDNFFDQIILTKAIGAQYPFFQEIEGEDAQNSERCVTENLNQALLIANKHKPQLIAIVGTQSLVGEARKILKKTLTNTKSSLIL